MCRAMCSLSSTERFRPSCWAPSRRVVSYTSNVLMSSLPDSDDSVEPTERVVRASVLDVDQGLAHLGGHRARVPSRGAVHLTAVPGDPADRSDDRRRPTGEHLGDPPGLDPVVPGLDREAALLHLVTDRAGELDDRLPGDTFEDRAG